MHLVVSRGHHKRARHGIYRTQIEHHIPTHTWHTFIRTSVAVVAYHISTDGRRRRAQPLEMHLWKCPRNCKTNKVFGKHHISRASDGAEFCIDQFNGKCLRGRDMYARKHVESRCKNIYKHRPN